MAEPIDIDALHPAQIAELFRHFMQLDQVRLAMNNGFAARLASQPDCTDAIRAMLDEWSVAVNAVGAKSDTEILRIVNGVPPTANLN